MLKFQHNQRKTVPIIFMIVGILLVGAAGYGVFDYWVRHHEGDTTPPSTTITTDTDAPSEKDPGPVKASYTVPANQPRVLSIPSIHVEAYVQKVGETKDGAVAVPNNVYFTGWYTKSVAPGEPGLSIIDGHEGGRYAAGVFKRLKELSAGQQVRVQMGDLSWREFTVVSVKSYPVDKAASALFNGSATGKELRLITCGGTFNDANQSYDHRVIVVARGA